MGFCAKLHPYLAEKCSDIIKLKMFENLRQSTVWQRHMCGQTDTKFLDNLGHRDTENADWKKWVKERKKERRRK